MHMIEGKESYDEADAPIAKKRITSEGKEWVARRKKEQEKFADWSNVFGSRELERWQFVNRRGKKYENWVEHIGEGKVLEEERKRCGKKVSSDVKNINAALSRVAEKNPEALQQVFERYFKDAVDIDKVAADLLFDYDRDDDAKRLINRKVKALLQKEGPSADRNALRKRVRHTFIAEEMAEVVARQYADEFPRLDTSEMLMPVIEYHAAWVAREEKEMVREMQEFQKRFRALAQGAIKTGAVSALRPLTMPYIDERLQTLQFEAVDGLWAALGEKWGDFLAEEHTVRLSADMPREMRWGTFVHEVFHALSGQEEWGLFDESPEFNRFEFTKIGAKFLNPLSELLREEPKQSNKRRPVLWWLNEALTETATRDFLKEGRLRDVYPKERALLDLLRGAGVPDDMLYRAYFENYAVKPAGEHRSPAVKALFDKTNELFGDGFLVRLDWYVRFQNQQAPVKKVTSSYGVECAVKEWKKRGVEFPRYIHEWAKEHGAR